MPLNNVLLHIGLLISMIDSDTIGDSFEVSLSAIVFSALSLSIIAIRLDSIANNPVAAGSGVARILGLGGRSVSPKAARARRRRRRGGEFGKGETPSPRKFLQLPWARAVFLAGQKSFSIS
jgi:hypothetical protein